MIDLDPSKRPVVALIGTGGTLSSRGRDSLDRVEYADTGWKLHPDELLEAFPEMRDAAEILPVRFKAAGSSSFVPADWIDLAEKVGQVARERPDLAGIVVTHGTASLEESAYFLHLTIAADMPVVLVGAQRPMNGLGTDAGANLLSAIRTAAAPQARGLGVLVVLNDEIHSAREVTKTSNWRLHTFRTHDMGALGSVDPDGTVALYRRPLRAHAPDTPFRIPASRLLPRVDILYAYPGADGVLVEAAIAAGAAGLVIAGTAPGSPTPEQREALIAARERGTLVVLSSRSGSGRVIARSRDARYGFVTADNLNPQKARILAMLALCITRDPATIQRFYADF